MYALKMHIYSSKGSNINQIIFQNMNFNINILRCPEFSHSCGLVLSADILRNVGSFLKNAKVSIFTASPLKMPACGTGRKFAEYDQRCKRGYGFLLLVSFFAKCEPTIYNSGVYSYGVHGT